MQSEEAKAREVRRTVRARFRKGSSEKWRLRACQGMRDSLIDEIGSHRAAETLIKAKGRGRDTITSVATGDAEVLVSAPIHAEAAVQSLRALRFSACHSAWPPTHFSHRQVQTANPYAQIARPSSIYLGALAWLKSTSIRPVPALWAARLLRASKQQAKLEYQTDTSNRIKDAASSLLNGRLSYF